MKTGQKFTAELIGTFVLVLGGCGTAVFAGGSVGVFFECAPPPLSSSPHAKVHVLRLRAAFVPHLRK